MFLSHVYCAPIALALQENNNMLEQRSPKSCLSNGNSTVVPLFTFYISCKSNLVTFVATQQQKRNAAPAYCQRSSTPCVALCTRSAHICALHVQNGMPLPAKYQSSSKAPQYTMCVVLTECIDAASNSTETYGVVVTLSAIRPTLINSVSVL